MTGKELRRARQQLGLTQKVLAEKLGVHKLTVARWEWGTVGISEPAARLVKLLVQTRRSPKGRR